MHCLLGARVYTLGKDSELAATLAQGKPVIAFVPQVPSLELANELLKQEGLEVLERLLHTFEIEGTFRCKSWMYSKLIEDFEKLEKTVGFVIDSR